MFEPKIFGQRLLMVRTKKGVTQAQVAQMLGVTATQVSDMEKGKTTTSLFRLYALCEYFNVSADYLLGRREEP